MLNYCWLILGLPLAVAAVIAGFIIPFEKAASNRKPFQILSSFLACAAAVAAFAVACCVTRHFFADSGKDLQSSFGWMLLPKLKIEIGILLNKLTLLMALIVTGVGSLVAIFSARYMYGEEGYSRYFAAFSFFVFSMLGIVFANNLIQLFIFWELVGVSSYLLIGFWFEKKSAALASKKAFLTTRIGDVGMMLGILLLFGLLLKSGTGTFNFLELSAFLPKAALPAGLLTLACLGLFCGAVGKSAQVPLHVWLPDAMEGPTPASALIHAATMVAAGVFMLARLSFLFAFSPVALNVIAWTGAATALIAALTAVVQDDIKKVLAYSTLSQLGYMVMALGTGNAEAGMFHLTTHAFFKALLFLGAGSLIHAAHTQDIWAISKTIRASKKSWIASLPVTGITFLIGTAALAGLPFTSGFFSKEEILGAAAGHSGLLFIVSLAVVLLTAFYMSRVITVVFFSNAKKEAHGHGELHEDNFLVTLPLIVLAVFSVIAGYLPFHSFLTSGEHAAIHHGPEWLAAVSVALACTGLITGFLLYRNKTSESHLAVFKPVVTLLKEKFFFDRFYDSLITYVQENLARVANGFENIVLNRAGADGLSGLANLLGKWARGFQNGWLQTYGLVFIIGWTVFICYMLGCGGRP